MLCTVLERCHAQELQHIQEAILSDSIWTRAFTIYLEKSDSAKGKSVRQVLITLTSILLQNQNERAIELQEQAIVTLIDIICQRQDRVKVKPALQALAHFLQKDVVTIPKLVDAYANTASQPPNTPEGEASVPILFKAFLSWVVHHDTALSAGHLIKNFLAQLRRTSLQDASNAEDSIASIWTKPVVDCLHQWPDRIQEFKTHVFPHCFLPNIDEFVQFLSYLHFPRHVGKPIPTSLSAHDTDKNVLEDFEEFRILLAAIQTGKELGIIKDVGKQLRKPLIFRSTIIS